MLLPIEKKLFAAIQKNDEALVRTILADIKTCNHELEQTESLKKITRPASIEVKDEKGYTPLIQAAKEGHFSIVQALLENGALIDNPSTQGSTPLMFAAQNGHENCLELLIKAKANLNAKGVWDRTSLMWAAASGKFNCVQLLLENKAELRSRDIDGCTAFSLAVKKEDTASALALLVANHDCYNLLTDSPEEMLFTAVTLNDIELLKRAITHVNQINKELKDEIKNHPSMKGMIDHIPSLNAKTQNNVTPLILAAKKNRIDCLKLLIENKADVNINSDGTALVWAAYEGHESCVKLLLEEAKEIDVNAKDSTGYTSLMAAASQEHESCVKLLLEEAKGIDLNVQSSYLRLTALHKAASHKNAKICELLITFGANTQLKDYSGLTASDLGCKQVIKSALKKQKNIHRPARELTAAELKPETLPLLSRLSSMWHNSNKKEQRYTRLPASDQASLSSIAIEPSSPKSNR